jgi:ADP-heptose:LPS heptosyltransferase
VRILLCNGALLGDLILSTAVLPVLKAAWPDAKIGFLVGSWSRPVLENHQLVDWIHIFDHTRLNLSPIAQKEKKKISGQMWRPVIAQIREKNYEMAIDLYYFYDHNSGSLLAHTGIPELFCFWASPAHFYFNRPLFWNFKHLHMLENHGMMLRALGISETHLSLLWPSLYYRDIVAEASLPEGFNEKKYCVVHPGTSDWHKEWSISSWERLIAKLPSLGYPIIFIGKGNKERELIQRMQNLVPEALNLCDQLSWRQVIPLIKRARFLVGLDSMAAHLAAALHTPSVHLYRDPECLLNWHAYNEKSISLAKPKMRGERISIHRIQPEEVFEAIQTLLNQC